MPKSDNALVRFSAFAAVAAFAWFFVWPNAQLVRDRYETWGQEKDDLVIIQQTAESINVAVEFADNLSSEERRLVSLAIPTYPNQYDIVVVLDKLAQESGVTLQTISTTPQAGAKEGDLERVGVAMSIEGSYDNVKSFLKSIETVLRIFDTESLGLITTTAEGEEQVFVLSLAGQVYYTPDTPQQQSGTVEFFVGEF